MTVAPVVDDTYTLCKKCSGVLIFDKDEQEFFHIGGGKECVQLDESAPSRYVKPKKIHRPPSDRNRFFWKVIDWQI